MKTSTISAIGAIVTQILAIPVLYQMFQQLYSKKLPDTLELQLFWVMFFAIALFGPPYFAFIAAYFRKMGD
jgi:uncharacterized protein with PQ loop repeat